VRRTENWVVQHRNRDGLVYGLLIALLLHLLLFLFFPTELVIPEIKEEPVKQIDINLLPDDPAIEPDQEYVASNPEAPEQQPEPTNNISERNQVAANPEQPEELSVDHTPANKGDMEESNRLVQGDPNQMSELSRQQAQQQAQEMSEATASEQSQSQAEEPQADQGDQVAEQAPSQPQPDLTQAQPRPEQPPRPPQEGEDPEDLANEGPNVVRIEPRPAVPPIPEQPRVQEQGASGASGATATDPSADQQASAAPVPRPRPSISRDRTTGPLKNSAAGVLIQGRVSFNAEYSQFGEYWAQVKEAIYLRWISLLRSSKSLNYGSNTHVEVTFHIQRDGEIVDLEIKESTAGNLEQTFAVDAVESPSPFRKWTPEMILIGDDKMECSVTFYY